MQAIECLQLQKRYEARKQASVDAVNGLDLEVRTGECFGLLGPNGAGKTTTIEILEGLLLPTAGEVVVLGMHWGERDQELRQRIGISLQETRFVDKLTVQETIQLFGSFYRQGRSVEEVMAEVSLNEKARALVEKLSGGQRQRLAVACALVGDPDLLFLDEPTTGLDPQSRRQLWETIHRHRARGRTTLLTTHYMDEAERLCDRVAIVDHGKVIASGSPTELITSLGGDHVVEIAIVEGADQIRTPIQGALIGLPSVSAVRMEAHGISLTVSEPHVAIPELLNLLRSRNLTLGRLTTRHVSLEDVFVNLTGRHLRDDEAPAA
jgi:ABC-2 type transport system ATP-binding protein